MPLRLINDAAFDPETTSIMARAYQEAAQAFGANPSLALKEKLARRIIDAAQRGERDLAKLKSIALEGLGKLPDTG